MGYRSMFFLALAALDGDPTAVALNELFRNE